VNPEPWVIEWSVMSLLISEVPQAASAVRIPKEAKTIVSLYELYCDS
jgi:hypothetical protein